VSLPPHRLWDFPGGVRLERRKAQSLQTPLMQMPPPPRIVLPLQQHIGELAEPMVEIGERALKGQVIARARDYVSAPVHASTSGTVVEIARRPVPSSSGFPALCVVIETDGREAWLEQRPNPIQDYRDADRDTLLARVQASGIVGLGGAAFPTAVKLEPEQKIDTLILNGVECEPYISCDETLMRARPQAVIEGARILRQVLGAEHCLIGLEDSAPDAYKALCDSLGGSEVDGLRVVQVPNRYPAGGERQLIKVLTGLEVPSGGLPGDVGVICHNVGTAVAVYRAIVHGEPLISRIVTVTGQGVRQPRNIEVLLGTPIADVVAYCGGYADQIERLIIGGPMMGLALETDEAPVVKATNCILVVGRGELGAPPRTLPCIHCGDCASACPALLLPQEIYRYAKIGDLEQAQAYNLFDCIECGCCAYVCPSHLPLVDYYRAAKEEIWGEDHDQHTAHVAHKRYEFHTGAGHK
jgi:Na+-translocating ferredoxin:NAD+ oxidoreductase subunit C